LSQTGQSLQVRPAKMADIPSLVDLLRELFGAERDFEFDAAKQTRGVGLLLSRGDGACAFVAELEGVVVGMATAQALVSTAEGSECALIEDVVVRSNKRGLGIGPQLLAAIEDWCRGRGIKRVQLLADKTNEDGIAFYAREGWSATRMVGLRKFIRSDALAED
jgi:GNAT superfamily N-acetyltransferase